MSFLIKHPVEVDASGALCGRCRFLTLTKCYRYFCTLFSGICGRHSAERLEECLSAEKEFLQIPAHIDDAAKRLIIETIILHLDEELSGKWPPSDVLDSTSESWYKECRELERTEDGAELDALYLRYKADVPGLVAREEEARK